MLPKNLFRLDWVTFSSQHDLQSSVASLPQTKLIKTLMRTKLELKKNVVLLFPKLASIAKLLLTMR